MIQNIVVDQDMCPPTSPQTEQAELQALRQEVAMYRNRLRYLEKWQHEFRGPMGAIIGYPLLLLDDQLEPIQQEALKAILDSGNLLLQTVEDFFSYISAETGQIEVNPMPFDLRAVVEDALHAPRKAAAERIVGINLTINQNVPTHVTSTRPILRQIITHLVNHAVKCAPNGQVNITVEATADQQELKIHVQDNGAGYKSEDKRQLQHLFAMGEIDQEIFDGLELRLVMCNRLCDFVNGRLEIESKFRKGATFTLTIPSESDFPLSS